MMAVTNLGQTCLALLELLLMLALWWRLIHFGVHCKFLERFANEIIVVNTLPLASLNGLISQLVRLLAKLVDEAESFLVLFLLLYVACLLGIALRGCPAHKLHDDCWEY